MVELLTLNKNVVSSILTRGTLLLQQGENMDTGSTVTTVIFAPIDETEPLVVEEEVEEVLQEEPVVV